MKAMLDTNAFDDIYTLQCIDKLKNAVSTGKITLYLTHVQVDEITKITDPNKVEKRDYILNAITYMPVEKIATSAGVVGTDKPIRAGFEGSPYGESRYVGEEDDKMLLTLSKQDSKNPMQNTADLMIAFTAVKEKMQYLVTNSTDDFDREVALMNAKLDGNVQVINVKTLLQILGWYFSYPS